LLGRDTDTDHAEQTRFIAEEARWIRIVNDLLEGKSVEGKTLAERMANEYQEFADFVDSDIDFMAMFKAGKFNPYVNNLFKQEARTLASIIVGWVMSEIKTEYWAKPIPIRNRDWIAYRDGNEESGPVGVGATEQEAIEDLMEQEVE